MQKKRIDVRYRPVHTHHTRNHNIKQFLRQTSKSAAQHSNRTLKCVLRRTAVGNVKRICDDVNKTISKHFNIDACLLYIEFEARSVKRSKVLAELLKYSK